MASQEFTTPGTFSWTAPVLGSSVEPYADAAYNAEGWTTGTDYAGSTGVYFYSRTGIQSGSGGARTVALPETKGYFEILISTTTPILLIGLARDTSVGGYNNVPSIYLNGGTAYGGLSGGTALGNFSSGDTFQIAYDAANNQVWFGKNNTYYRSTTLSGATIPGTGNLRCILMSGTGSTVTTNGTFRRAINNVYTPPSGFTGYSEPGPYGVSVVAIGGGGSGGAAYYAGGGGGGGGLGWKNNITVTPGQSYTVVVGAGGVGVTAASGGQGTAGGDSYFINTSTVAGLGGGAGIGTSANDNVVRAGGTGGGYVGDGGGNGGAGGSSSGDTAGGGGGTGGYTGNGGAGGGNSGTGGAAAGGMNGGGNGSAGAAGSGGGVGLDGLNTSGTSPSAGGSLGQNGSYNLTVGGSANTGGLYGGGGGGQANDSKNTPGCNGGGGAVKIFWPATEFTFPESVSTITYPRGYLDSNFTSFSPATKTRSGLLSSTSIVVSYKGSFYVYELILANQGVSTSVDTQVWIG